MDWQLTCRICLENGDMVSLFDWDENNEQLADKYAYCCGVEVTKHDKLPTLICLSCVDKLTESYQFKQQCLSSVETLKDCLEEFLKTSSEATETTSNGTELITIKQENGTLLQFELPIESDVTWKRTLTKNADKAVVTKEPKPHRRGRPRKYPNNQGQIEASPYQRKRQKHTPEQSLTEIIENAELKQEPDDEEEEDAGDVDDPDFQADDDDEDEEDQEEEELEVKIEGTAQPQKKRGRPRKHKKEKITPKEEEMDAETEDMLLKETILAMSEPIPDHVMNPKPKKPKPTGAKKKKYTYEKIHTCETCGKGFASNSALQAHIRRHLGIKPYVCSICGYACVLSMELRRHMYRHTGKRPYQCRICERAFADFGSRQKHERLHMGLKPYICSVCGKSFTYSYVLSNHMLIHTGEKKYSCAPCNRKFTKAHHLKYHNKVHHKDLYKKMVEEAEAKKQRQNIKIGGLISGQIVNGQLQIITEQTDDDDNDNEDNMMEVVEISQEAIQEMQEQQQRQDLETDRAVAGMQADDMNEEYII